MNPKNPAIPEMSPAARIKAAVADEPRPLLEIDAHLRVGDFELAICQSWSQPATAVFGSSGAGKSLLIELLAGFRRLDRGRLRFDGQTLDDGGSTFVPPAQRRFGWVPQDLALWPHMTVRRNIDYALAAENGSLRARAIELLELGDLLNRRPAQLSGGQQQRVALARAVASAPRLLLLDEPLVSLDAPLRARIASYIRVLERELGIPFLYVSHDRHELYALARHVLVVQAGRCVAAGPPERVLGNPHQPLDLEQVRFENRFSAVVAEVAGETGRAALRVNDDLTLWAPLALAPAIGQQVEVGLDPADIILSKTAPTGLSAQNVVPAVIEELLGDASPIAVWLRHDSRERFKVFLTPAAVRDLQLEVGGRAWLVFKAHALHVL